MIIDSSRLEPGHRIEADLCIIGAGAAGITLASRFAKGPFSVCVLESGGTRLERVTQSLYAGRYTGEVPSLDSSYLVTSRLRMFGGTTNVWNGYCRPLEAIDFERREWVPGSGWPLSRSDLDPHYAAASDFMGFGRFDADNPDAGAAHSYFEGPDTSEKVFRFHAKRFGAAHRDELRDSKNVTVYLHANALDVAASPEGNAVESVRAASLSGREFSVKARHWVIAAGGIENARLLLASDGVHRNGLGNQHDQVGRYFMDHPTVEQGLGPLVVWPRFPMDLYEIHGQRDSRANFVYPTNAVARRDKLLSVSISFEYEAPEELFGEADDAVVAAARGVDGFPGPPTQRPPPSRLNTAITSESAPNPRSRVRLIREQDALGMRRVEVDWRLTGLELHTINWCADRMSRRVGELGMGRMKVAAEKDEVLGLVSSPHHHMGTTRMHDDPKQGVVDASCRVHGIRNLYVAGSSVFPTSGAANPTFTIVALALRLADHLERELANR